MHNLRQSRSSSTVCYHHIILSFLPLLTRYHRIYFYDDSLGSSLLWLLLSSSDQALLLSSSLLSSFHLVVILAFLSWRQRRRFAASFLSLTICERRRGEFPPWNTAWNIFHADEAIATANARKSDKEIEEGRKIDSEISS